MWALARSIENTLGTSSANVDRQPIGGIGTEQFVAEIAAALTPEQWKWLQSTLKSFKRTEANRFCAQHITRIERVDASENKCCSAVNLAFSQVRDESQVESATRRPGKSCCSDPKPPNPGPHRPAYRQRAGQPLQRRPVKTVGVFAAKTG